MLGKLHRFVFQGTITKQSKISILIKLSFTYWLPLVEGTWVSIPWGPAEMASVK